MSVLSDRMILGGLRRNIVPFNEENVQPNSYELTLDNELLVIPEPDSVPRTRGDADQWEKITFSEKGKGECYQIQPGQFLLASTRESVDIPANLVAEVMGKSSWARVGLFIHVTAGFVDSGFTGNITLELYNAAPYPIVIHEGEPIAQLVFYQVSGEVGRKYGDKELGSHYQDQDGVTPSRR